MKEDSEKDIKDNERKEVKKTDIDSYWRKVFPIINSTRMKPIKILNFLLEGYSEQKKLFNNEENLQKDLITLDAILPEQRSDFHVMLIAYFCYFEHAYIDLKLDFNFCHTPHLQKIVEEARSYRSRKLIEMFEPNMIHSTVLPHVTNANEKVTIPEGLFETVFLNLSALLKDKDRKVSIAVSRAIGQLSIPEDRFETVCGWLNTWLKDDDREVRRAAAKVIGQLTVPEGQFETVCVRLDTLLKDKHEYVRSHAAEVIGQLTVPEGQFETFSGWLNTLLKDRNKDVRYAAAKVIGQLSIPEGQFETVCAWLNTLLKDDDEGVRKAAAQAIGQLTVPEGQFETVLGWLDTLLKDDKWCVREAAAEVIEQLSIPEGQFETFSVWLDTLLKDDNYPVRQTAARAINKLTIPEGQFETVCVWLDTLLNDKHVLVRTDTAEVIGHLSIPEGQFETVCVRLDTLLKDENGYVRYFAAMAIGQLTVPEDQFETVRVWLDTALKDDDWEVQEAAAEVIGQLSIPEDRFETVCVWLNTWLKNTDEDVRYLTATAIGELTIPEGQFKTVCVWLDTWLKDKDRYVRRAAAKLIGQLTVPEGQFETICVWLDTLLKDNDEYMRQAAAEVIGQLSIPKGQFETVCGWLNTLLNDDHRMVREAAAKVIGQLTVPEGQFETVCGWLNTLLKDDDEGVRKAAAQAIGQLTVPEGQFETVFGWLDTLLKDNDERVHRAVAEHADIILSVLINTAKSFPASYSIKLLMTLFIHLEKKCSLSVDDQTKYSYLKCLFEIQKCLDHHKVKADNEYAMKLISEPAFIKSGYKGLSEKNQKQLSIATYQYLIPDLWSKAQKNVVLDEDAENICRHLNVFFLRNGDVEKNVLVLNKFMTLGSAYAERTVDRLWDWVLVPHQPYEEDNTYLQRLALRVIHHHLAGNKLGKLRSIVHLMEAQQEFKELGKLQESKTSKVAFKREVLKEYKAKNTPQYMRALDSVCTQVLAMNMGEKLNGVNKIKFVFLHHFLINKSEESPVVVEKTAHKALKDCIKQKILPELIQYLYKKGTDVLVDFFNQFQENIARDITDCIAELEKLPALTKEDFETIQDIYHACLDAPLNNHN